MGLASAGLLPAANRTAVTFNRKAGVKDVSEGDADYTMQNPGNTTDSPQGTTVTQQSYLLQGCTKPAALPHSTQITFAVYAGRHNTGSTPAQHLHHSIAR
eukprot:GHRR01033636.1.p2 GENE.GHRR01033636.1~~GHRR01033636.1.p2  ORF type:complete len:100 (+),score=28.04 GHRR01033636.1:301-600(+)